MRAADVSKLKRLIAKHGLRRVGPSILALAGDGLELRTKPARGRTLPAGATKFGGLPDAAPGFRWPMRGRRPLTLIAQINMKDIPLAHRWPQHGLLLFFYDAQEQPWGDPGHRGSSRIIHVKGPKALRRQRMPGRNRKSAGEAGDVLPECAVTLSPRGTIPAVDNPSLEAILVGEKERSAYLGVYFDYADPLKGRHQFRGWPLVIQNDMESSCQLAFHGLDRGIEGDDAIRAQVYLGGASRWQMVLQVTSDDNLGVMWGDLGNIYFYATAEAQASLRYDETWTELQCT